MTLRAWLIARGWTDREALGWREIESRRGRALAPTHGRDSVAVPVADVMALRLVGEESPGSDAVARLALGARGDLVLVHAGSGTEIGAFWAMRDAMLESEILESES